MNENNEDKLNLDKETIVQLTQEQMEQMEGGSLPTTWTQPETDCMCEM